MKLVCAVILFVGVFALNDATVALTMKRFETDQLLIKTIMQARAAPGQSYASDCFNFYLPILDEIQNEFQTSYLACGTTAQAQNAELDLEARGNQTLITSAAQDVCSTMTQCSALTDSLPFLDCYSQVGDTNIKSIYVITNNASEVAANLREQYSLVENKLLKCQNASERNYVEATATTTEALTYCFENGPPAVVTTTPVPEETTTADETTVEPTAADLEEEDLSRSAPVVPVVPAVPVAPVSLRRPSVRANKKLHRRSGN